MAGELTKLAQIDGLNSGLYSMFTATFVGIGLAFILFPVPSKAGMFGDSQALSDAALLLWRYLGAAVSLIVGPIAFTQQVETTMNEQ